MSSRTIQIPIQTHMTTANTIVNSDQRPGASLRIPSNMVFSEDRGTDRETPGRDVKHIKLWGFSVV